MLGAHPGAEGKVPGLNRCLLTVARCPGARTTDNGQRFYSVISCCTASIISSVLGLLK